MSPTFNLPFAIIVSAIESDRSSSRVKIQPLQGKYMRKLTTIIGVAVLVLLGTGAAFLATWEIPPPSAKVEKVIPDDRFSR